LFTVNSRIELDARRERLLEEKKSDSRLAAHALDRLFKSYSAGDFHHACALATE
jgi:hypothetical protein